MATTKAPLIQPTWPGLHAFAQRLWPEYMIENTTAPDATLEVGYDISLEIRVGWLIEPRVVLDGKPTALAERGYITVDELVALPEPARSGVMSALLDRSCGCVLGGGGWHIPSEF